MSNVVPLNCITILPLTPERVLDAAKEKVDLVVVLGYEPGTTNLYFSSSTAELSVVLMLLERAKHQVMQMVDKK